MPYAQKSKYRITLEIEAMDDFNPHQIDWEKLFELQGDEKVETYIEDLSSKYDSLWWLCEVSIEKLCQCNKWHTTPSNAPLIVYSIGVEGKHTRHTLNPL